MKLRLMEMLKKTLFLIAFIDFIDYWRSLYLLVRREWCERSRIKPEKKKITQEIDHFFFSREILVVWKGLKLHYEFAERL